MKPASGEIIDRYKITGEIGTGGMGSVYSAIDMELSRTVAVKILHMDSSDAAEQKSRFRREVKALSSFNHPNVVRVFAVGTWRKAFPYLVMELLEGESLAALLARRTTLSELEALTILRDVVKALAAVHALGIIHRDLKPQNIFLARQADKTVVKVLDFGLCRAVTAADEHLTATGLLVGSVHYMSPEGSSGRVVSPKSDVYALGVILYEMLTGTPPFQSDTMIGVLYKHANVEAPLLAESGVSLPHAEAFDRVLTRCLAKDEANRYQSAQALGADLELLQSLIESPSDGPVDYSALGAAPSRALHRKSKSALLRVFAVAAAGLAVVGLLVLAKPRITDSPVVTVVSKPDNAVYVRRSLESLKQDLHELRRRDQQRVLSPLAEAMRMIDSWIAQAKPASDDVKLAMILKAQWLIPSNNQADRAAAEKILKSLLAEVQGKNDLLELMVRTEMAALYNRSTDKASMLPVTEPVYEIWKKHSESPAYAKAAYGALRMRACQVYLPDTAEEDSARLKLLEVAEICRVSAVAEGPYLEDLGNYIDRLIERKEFQKAKPFCDRNLAVVAELHRDFRGRDKFLSQALLRKAEVLQSEKQFSEASALRERAQKIEQTKS